MQEAPAGLRSEAAHTAQGSVVEQVRTYFEAFKQRRKTINSFTHKSVSELDDWDAFLDVTVPMVRRCVRRYLNAEAQAQHVTGNLSLYSTEGTAMKRNALTSLLLLGLLTTPAWAESPRAIPGYTMGQATLATAPYTLADLDSLKKTLLFTAEDERYLRQSKAILADQADAVLDVWYGFVAGTPELVYYFGNSKSGKPDGAYLAAVRKRFSQWILDTADARYDQAWLDYQYEIGLRHSRIKKNRTDGADSVDQINFRYLPALTIPVTTTLKPFLAKKGASAAEVEKMHAAWVKSVLMQTILWSHPYVRDGQF